MHFPNDNLLTDRLEHLRARFERQTLILLPKSEAQPIEAALNSLPWAGSTLDWDSGFSGGVTVSSDELVRTTAVMPGTEFEKHGYAMAFFSFNEPVVAGEMLEILQNLDAIFWKAPGTRFVFAATVADGVWSPVLTDFLQYQGTDSVVISR
jgi:hypothetical protein